MFEHSLTPYSLTPCTLRLRPAQLYSCLQLRTCTSSSTLCITRGLTLANALTCASGR